MGDVDAVVLGDDRHHRDEVLGAGVAAGRIDQRGGDAEGAVLHRLGRHPAHDIKLSCGRRAHPLAHRVLAQRPITEE